MVKVEAKVVKVVRVAAVNRSPVKAVRVVDSNSRNPARVAKVEVRAVDSSSRNPGKAAKAVVAVRAADNVELNRKGLCPGFGRGFHIYAVSKSLTASPAIANAPERVGVCHVTPMRTNQQFDA